jgi:hypothetical protein
MAKQKSTSSKSSITIARSGATPFWNIQVKGQVVAVAVNEEAAQRIKRALAWEEVVESPALATPLSLEVREAIEKASAIFRAAAEKQRDKGQSVRA